MKKSQDPVYKKIIPKFLYVAKIILYPIAIIITLLTNYKAISHNPELLDVYDLIKFIALSIGLIAAIIYVKWLYKKVAGKIYSLVVPNNTATDDETKKITYSISLMIFSGVLSILILLGFDFFAHARSKQLSFKKIIEGNFPIQKIGEFLGTFGDFFGGVVNPILTFLTFIALTVTLVMQRIQLKESGELSRLQTFESTFFNLLNLHHASVEDLILERENTLSEIKNSLMNRSASHNVPTLSLLEESSSQEKLKNSERKIHNPLTRLTINSRRNRTSPQKEVIRGRQVFTGVLGIMQDYAAAPHNIDPIKIYEIIQKNHNHILGRHFRNFYQILDFIDTYAARFVHEKDSLELPGKRYSDIFRAQLSTSEILVLFYNCHENMVDHGEFRELIKKYEILEHMSVKRSSPGQLGVPGYQFDITQITAQYFYYIDNDLHIETPGAFGSNSEIEEYLIHNFDYKPVAKSKNKI